METDYDVIVAGGGLAGKTTAMAIAKYSNQQLRILVVDRNPTSEVGKKTSTGWSCGDATSQKSFDFMCENIGVTYDYPELEHRVKGLYLYSPDHEERVLFEGPGYLLNRKVFPQKQLRQAEKFGVEFKFQVALRKLLVDDGFVRGVEGTDLSDNSVYRKTGKIVIDAAGSSSVLRLSLPPGSKPQREIDRDDMESTGRYILEFDYGTEDKTYFDPDYLIIHLDQDLAPGGYSWTFAKGKNKVNIGLGVQNRALKLRNKRTGKNDTLKSLIDEYVKRNPVIKNPRFPNGTQDAGNEYNTWQVAVRRQNDCLVANGYLGVGDSMWMPRALDAGGIGPIMYASVIAGKTVAAAVEAVDFSEGALWTYNVEYVKAVGHQMASFEVLRKFLQTLSNEQISYGMKHFFSEEDVAHIARREHPPFSRVRLLNPVTIFRIVTHLRLARGLRYTAKKSERLIRLYYDYPESPEEFSAWRGEMLREVEEADKRFGLK